jgi:hypothetical protein
VDYLTRPKKLAVALLAVAGFTLVGCNSPDESTEAVDDSAASQDVSWTTIKGFKVPASETSPSNTETTPPTGYAQDEFGAAIAAANLSIALDSASEKDFGEILNVATVNDEGRKQWAAARAGLIVGQPQTDKMPDLLAWTTELSEDASTATVFLYWQQWDGSFTEQRRELVWQDGDWKLKLPANPQTPQLRAVVEVPPEATEFTPPSN